MQKAVIKGWSPCAAAPFVIVFDSEPKKEFHEDLWIKKKDWKQINWENHDIWETSDLRPMCPECGIPLGEGAAAWTSCHGCGTPEPGAMSFGMATRRVRNDPYRNPQKVYHDDDDDDDE